MGRPDLSSRTRTTLTRLADRLADRKLLVGVVGVGTVVAVAGHLLVGDPRIAWLAVPFVFVAGMVAGTRPAFAVALVAALAHAIVDVALGAEPLALVGIVLRTAAFCAIGLLGATGAQLERQRDQAMHRVVNEDPVTGLLSVRAFYDELEVLRDAGEPFAILLADIRGMRRLNEQYGHPTGTEAMRALAHVLRRSAGPDVLASRLGSDEVAVALVGADRDVCRTIVNRIVERLHDEQVSLPDGKRFEVHAAYGVARFPEDGADEISVLRAADRAKELAKEAGLDRAATPEGQML